MKRGIWLFCVALVALISVALVVHHQEAIQQENARGTISEVMVEHTGCYGVCPIYRLILRSDNTATFIGQQYTDRIGTYRADVGDFTHVSEAIREAGFFGLGDSYTARVTDQPSVITSVVRDGKRKTVDNYGDAGPQRLWELQALVDGTVAQSRWTKVSNSTAYPEAR